MSSRRQRLAWMINRLRCMSPGEIGHRAWRSMQARLESRGLGLARRPPAADATRHGQFILHDFTPADPQPWLAAADAVLAGRFDVFSRPACPLGFPPDWQRDPLTGTRAPDGFGKRLNYRDEKQVGNIKYLWEPSRHLQLTTLAQAWKLSGEARYQDGCRILLDSWFAQNPYPNGVHWVSSLESAIRLLNWAAAWQLLGGEDAPIFAGTAGAAFRQRWLDMIYQHGHFIAGHLSRHSSANNHLLGELLGLLVCSLIWPKWPASTTWQAQARSEFAAEILKQNGSDGVNREQAVYYQHEVAEMILIGGLCLRANGLDLPAECWQRLHGLLEFLRSVMTVNGEIPMIGDSDDAHLLRLDPDHAHCPYQSLLAQGAVLFNDAALAHKVRHPAPAAGWLFGAGAFARLDHLRASQPPSPPTTAFPEGGYYLLGQDFDSPDEIRLLADAGPLGYLSIAAHGHADALAFTLSAKGEDFLIDPGTYSYHTEGAWRDYFRGTSAHNTVRIDGEDQSLIGGAFMWLRHAQTHCQQWISNAQADDLLAEHDGYTHLADPVRHQRRIRFAKPSAEILVEDVLHCAGTHQVEIFWHCHEAASVRIDNGAVLVERPGGSLRIALHAPGFAVRLVSGQEKPPLGWISRHFDQKTPSTVAIWSGPIHGTTRLASRLDFLPKIDSATRKTP